MFNIFLNIVHANGVLALMSGKQEAKRVDLKRRLMEAADRQIGEHGVAALRARDITAAAGCALGGLYTAFEDLDDLILHVNSRTIADLGATLGEAAGRRGDPGDKLRALAQAYLGFARDHPNHWKALFDHRMPPGTEVPQWHLDEHVDLIAQVAGPVAVLRPDLNDDAIAVRARTFFAVVHGLVSITVEARFIGLPDGQLEREIDRVVDALVAAERTRAG